MLIKKRPSWAMAEADATSEHIYLNRREWLRAAGFAGLGLTTALTGVGGFAAAAAAAIEGYPASRNMAYRLDRDITPEDAATTYTNLDHQRISGNGRKSWLPIRGWLQLMVWLKLKCSLMPKI